MRKLIVLLAIVLLAACGEDRKSDAELKAAVDAYLHHDAGLTGDLLGSDTAAGPDGDTPDASDQADGEPDGAGADAAPEIEDDTQLFDADPCPPGKCDDGNPCTIDLCDVDGKCDVDLVADGENCGDFGGTCKSGECVGGEVPDGGPTDVPDTVADVPSCPGGCDDSNPCTKDFCSVAGTCSATKLSDGTGCGTAGGKCASGKCVVVAKCGDGAVQLGANPSLAEQCDDGATQDGDGCSALCLWECGSLSLGAGGALSVANQATLNLQTGDFTVEALVRPSAVDKDHAVAAMRPQKGTGVGWSFGFYSGALAFRVGGGAAAAGYVTAVVSAPGAVAGKWQHVAATYAAGSKTLKLWANGGLVAQVANFAAPGYSDAALRLGQEDDSGFAQLTGDVAYVRISSTVRYGAPFAVPLAVHADAKTVLHLPLQGSAADAGPNGWNGNLVGTASFGQNAPGCSAGWLCGDGKQADWEGCDDSNTAYGDGCDGTCRAETPPLGGLMDTAYAADPTTGGGWLFAGEAYYQLNATTWRYSPLQTESTWTPYEAIAAPPARARSTLVRNPATGQLFLFGGQGYYNLYNDLWRLEPQPAGPPKWTELKPSVPLPPERHAHVAYWDAASARLVVGLGEGFYQLHDDWWAYSPAANAWTKLTAPSTKVAPRKQAAVTQNLSGLTWLVGGEGYYTLHAEVFQLALAGDQVQATAVAIAGLPALTRSCAVAAAGKLMVVSGQTYYDVPALAWTWDGAKLTSVPAPAKAGGVCQRRLDGKVLQQLGEGFYQMTAGPWLGPLL